MDPLDEDPILPSGQTLALITFITEPGEQKMALKIRGAFRSKEEADRHMERLNSEVPTHMQTPTFLVETGKWLCMPPPSPDDVIEAGGSEVYQEEFLSNLVKGHRDSREKAKSFFKERQQMIKENTLTSDPEPLQGNIEPLPAPLDPFTGVAAQLEAGPGGVDQSL